MVERMRAFLPTSRLRDMSRSNPAKISRARNSRWATERSRDSCWQSYPKGGRRAVSLPWADAHDRGSTPGCTSR